jgi:hypothetical protein
VKTIFAVVMFIMLSRAAFSEGDLVGTWRMVKEECQSGSPFKAFGDAMNSNVQAVVTFTPTQETRQFQLSMQYNKQYAEKTLKALETATMTVDLQSAGAAREKMLQELEEASKLAQQYADGVNCSIEQSSKYTLSGHTLRTMPSENRKSNCPGEEHDVNGMEPYDSEIELSGDTLKVASVPDEDGMSCPKGDRPVSIFQRVK